MLFLIVLRQDNTGGMLSCPQHTQAELVPQPSLAWADPVPVHSCGAGGCHGSACSSSPLGRELSYATSSIKTQAATLPQWVSSLASGSRRMEPVQGRTARVTPQGHSSTHLPAASTSPGSDAAALGNPLRPQAHCTFRGGRSPLLAALWALPPAPRLCQLRETGQALGVTPFPASPNIPQLLRVRRKRKA